MSLGVYSRHVFEWDWTMFSKFAYHSRLNIITYSNWGDLPDRFMAPTIFTRKNHSSNMGDQKSPQIIAKISCHNDSYPKRSFPTAWMFPLKISQHQIRGWRPRITLLKLVMIECTLQFILPNFVTFTTLIAPCSHLVVAIYSLTITGPPP
jgi:hypothetical protein